MLKICIMIYLTIKQDDLPEHGGPWHSLSSGHSSSSHSLVSMPVPPQDAVQPLQELQTRPSSQSLYNNNRSSKRDIFTESRGVMG